MQKLTKINVTYFRNLRHIILAGIFTIIAFPSFAAPNAYLGADNLIVIDTTTNTETATITPNGYAFTKVEAHPSGNFIYVPVKPTGTFSPAFLEVYNTSNNSLVATIPIGVNPLATAITSSGDFIYVASASAQVGGSTRIISVVDTSTNTVSATIELDQSLSGRLYLAVHPTADILYVGASPSFNPLATITSFDTNTLLPVDTININVGSTVRDLAMHPSGQYIYVLSNSALQVFNTSTNNVDNSIALNGGYAIAVHPDGNTVYVSQYTSRLISVIDTNTNTVTASVSISSYPTDLEVHPNGNSVYITGFSSTMFTGTLSVFDIANNQVTDSISTATIPYNITLGPLPEPVGGTTTGLSSVSVTCTNSTSGQSVTINLGNETAWDCESSGLQVNTGDSIEMVVTGIAK